MEGYILTGMCHFNSGRVGATKTRSQRHVPGEGEGIGAILPTETWSTPPPPPNRDSAQVGGTHPTGMHPSTILQQDHIETGSTSTFPGWSKQLYQLIYFVYDNKQLTQAPK